MKKKFKVLSKSVGINVRKCFRDTCSYIHHCLGTIARYSLKKKKEIVRATFCNYYSFRQSISKRGMVGIDTVPRLSFAFEKHIQFHFNERTAIPLILFFSFQKKLLERFERFYCFQLYRITGLIVVRLPRSETCSYSVICIPFYANSIEDTLRMYSLTRKKYRGRVKWRESVREREKKKED